jgi:hypothetical protein
MSKQFRKRFQNFLTVVTGGAGYLLLTIGETFVRLFRASAQAFLDAMASTAQNLNSPLRMPIF